MGTCPGSPTPLSPDPSVVPGGRSVGVSSPSLREEAGTRRAGIARRPTTPRFFPQNSHFLNLTDSRSLFIVSPAATGRRLQSCEFSGTESGVTQKLPVTTVGEQKPKAESVFKTTSTLIQYLSLVTVIVDMEGRGDGE